MELLKLIFDQKGDTLDDYEECDYEEDVRAIIMSHQLDLEIEHQASISKIQGKFKYYYQKILPFQNFLLIAIVITTMLQKPQWCYEQGDNMLPDCSADVSGEVEYYLLNTVFIKPRISFIITFGFMYFILMLQILKVQTQSEVPFKEALKMYLLIFFFSLSLFLTFMETIEVLGRTEFNSFLKLLFVFCCQNELLLVFYRIYKILVDGWGFIFFLLICLFLFGTFFRILLYGEEIGQEQIIFSYSFTTFWRSFESMMITLMGGNLPDFVTDISTINPLYPLFIYIYNFAAATFIVGIFAGGVGQLFMDFYTITLRKVAQQHPNAKEAIENELELKFYDTEAYERVKGAVLRNIQVEQTPGRNQTVLNSAMKKFKRAIQKLKALRNFNAGENTQFTDLYKEIKEHFLYQLFFFILSMYIIYQPLFVLDRTFVNEVTACYNVSQLVTLIFLIELFLIYKIQPNNFWNFFTTIETVSTFGIIIFANILYIQPANFDDHEIITSYPLYLAWASCCLLKFFRVSEFLMLRVRIKIMIKSCIDVMPVFKEILLMLATVTLIYGMIGVFLFGGKLNTNFIQEYEDATGDEIDEDYLTFNMNDLLNSIFYFTQIMINGAYDGLTQQLVILQYVSDPHPFKLWLVKMFGYSYLIIMELLVMNVLLVFIGGILGLYEEKNVEDIEKQDEQLRNKKLIDTLLNKQRFDGEPRSDDEDKEFNEDEEEEEEIKEESQNSIDAEIEEEQDNEVF